MPLLYLTYRRWHESNWLLIFVTLRQRNILPPFLIVRICYRITCTSDLSKRSSAALESLAVHGIRTPSPAKAGATSCRIPATAAFSSLHMNVCPASYVQVISEQLLTDCFDIPKGMEPVVNNYKINLLEHAYLTDQDADRFAAKKQLTLMGKSVMISVVRGSVGTGRRARLRI